MTTDCAQHVIHKLNPELRERRRRVLELTLLTIVMGIMTVLHAVPRFELVLLNLYFVPVTLSGFYLGRYRAGVMALLCVLTATFTTIFNVVDVQAGYEVAPAIRVLAILVWGCVLALIAFVVGTLSDERNREMEVLQESHKTDTLQDPLTGVANRRAFEFELKRRVADWQTRGVPVCLILLDVDHFKKFNDTYGHQAGDSVLQGVAQTIEDTIRSADLVARYGGEEFAAILPNTKAESAKEIGERARQRIEQARFEFEDLTLRLTISVGASQLLPGEPATGLVERADAALYASKQAGRNCAHFHDGEACQPFGAPPSSVPIADPEPAVTPPVDAYTDAATKLPSRKVFLEELRRRVLETRRYGTKAFSLALLELDDPGDPQVEERLIPMLGAFFREDLRGADLVARYAQRQFAVLMPSTGLGGARTWADRLRDKVKQWQGKRLNGMPLTFTVSAGLAQLGEDEDAEGVLERAEAAILAAAQHGDATYYSRRGTSQVEIRRSDSTPVAPLPLSGDPPSGQPVR